MLWKFTCYNGTVWEAQSQMDLIDAVERFKKETGLSSADIKLVENLH